MNYPGLAADRRFARTRMPKAIETSSGGCIGFKYDITCEFNRLYELFLWFNGSRYWVMVISPEVEKGPLGYHTHVLPDGTLCLEPTHSGCRTMEEAYGKSVLWANGYSVYLETRKFPW